MTYYSIKRLLGIEEVEPCGHHYPAGLVEVAAPNVWGRDVLRLGRDIFTTRAEARDAARAMITKKRASLEKQRNALADLEAKL